MMTVPIWLVALIFAFLAPWGVKGLACIFERQSRRRTARVLTRALAETPRTMHPNEGEGRVGAPPNGASIGGRT